MRGDCLTLARRGLEVHCGISGKRGHEKARLWAGLGEAETVLQRVGLFSPMDAIREIEQTEQSQADKLHEK